MDDSAKKAKRIPPLFPIPEIVKHGLMVDMKNTRLLLPMGTGEPEVVPTRVTGGSGHQAVSITDFPTDRRWKHPDEEDGSDELSAEYYHEPLILVDGEREPPPLSEDAR